MDNSQPTTFVKAMKDFFEVLPGKMIQDFAAELKALSEPDRAELRAGLEAKGYSITAAG